ncbi:MAG: hypothetical protein ACI9JP_003222 [Granulosicoccus sp.]
MASDLPAGFRVPDERDKSIFHKTDDKPKGQYLRYRALTLLVWLRLGL